MLATTFCHTLIKESLGWMHKKTRDSLRNHVNSLLANGSVLCLHSIGRNLLSSASDKSKINMAWRFSCNKKIQENINLIYRDIFKELLTGLKELIIAVDWSGCCGADTHLLRASLVFEGRSLVVYNEVHPQSLLGNEQIQSTFLKNLQLIIPADKPVIILTDGGFKTPWFSAVESLGWYFIGRIRGKFSYKLKGSRHWLAVEDLYSQTSRGKTLYIGLSELGKKAYKTRIKGVLMTHWGNKKGRKTKTIRYPDAHKSYSKLNSEPWVLFSNLYKDKRFADEKKPRPLLSFMKKAYAKRMQIEQNFRDDKSIRYGFGWRLSGTKNPAKISLLLLIASIASFILWMIGFVAEKRKLQFAYQANTIKHRRVLSFLFLARQLIKRGLKKLKIRKFNNLIYLFHLEFNKKSLLQLLGAEEPQK